MSTYIQNFKKFRPLLNELIMRDIKTKYRKSILGVFWTILNPLFMMVVLSVVFSNMFKFDVEFFPVYLLSGQLIFNFFNEATTNAMGAIVMNGPLIKKIYVPKYMFVLSRIFSSSINDLCDACNARGLALYGFTGTYPIILYCNVFVGSWSDLISDYREIQRYHASVFRVCYCADVPDTGYLPDVNFAGMVEEDCVIESDHQYSDDV